MPPKRSKAFKLAKASVLGRTTTRSDSDSVEDSSNIPSVPIQRQLYLPSSSLPTTPDVTVPQTEIETPTSGPAALDIRINSRRRHVEPTEEPLTKKAKQGIVTGKSVRKLVANNEGKRLPLKWSMDKRFPDTNNVTMITKQIGSIVREHIPMSTGSYLNFEQDQLKVVVDHLSVDFELDWNGSAGDALFEWIHVTAHHAYRRWKSSCHLVYKFQGRNPIPQNFEQ